METRIFRELQRAGGQALPHGRYGFFAISVRQPVSLISLKFLFPAFLRSTRTKGSEGRDMTIGCTVGMSRLNKDTSTDANTNCRQQTNADEKRQRSIFCTAALDILQVRENAKKAPDGKLV